MGEEGCGKTITEAQYGNHPNVFCTDLKGASNFLKNVIWAARAIEFGYVWVIGNDSN
jgi:hypothetical protein